MAEYIQIGKEFLIIDREAIIESVRSAGGEIEFIEPTDSDIGDYSWWIKAPSGNFYADTATTPIGARKSRKGVLRKMMQRTNNIQVAQSFDRICKRGLWYPVAGR